MVSKKIYAADFYAITIGLSDVLYNNTFGTII